MNSETSFETPENVQVSYQTAGPGKRLIAWVVDAIFLSFAMFVLFFLTLLFSTVVGQFVDEVLSEMAEDSGESSYDAVGFGIMMLIWGVGSFFYFFIFELLFRGQTPGKKSVGIRVARLNGFSLDPFSVFLRNVVRFIDNPMTGLWLVAAFNGNHRRVGDLIAGTIVLDDEKPELSPVREHLAQQSALDARFHFDHTRLGRIEPEEFEKLEVILTRLEGVPDQQKQEVLRMVVLPLAQKMDMDPPPEAEHRLFLEQLLAAEFRRQNRSLG
ncbi:MAG: RDD family protein [Planctomycetota bacterium]|nr:RDD family protein [Planctomycetota bacterium]